MEHSQNSLLSIILPAHNEQDNITAVIQRMSQLLEPEGIRYELIFVNDGSSDNTWSEIKKSAEQFPQVRGICLSRQFGKEPAIYAGLEAAVGDCCVVMDCDLQHPPEKILEMWNLWLQGYEIVEGVKHTRGSEHLLYGLGARCFYRLISRSTGIDMQRSSDFKLLDRKAVLVLLNMPERNTFFRALSSWIGFKTTQIEFDTQPRTTGQSSWSTWSLIRYAIKNITSFSSAPLQIVTFLGFLMLLASVLQGGEALYRWAIGQAVEGFTTVILLQLFTGSLLMISLGIIGYYISRIYEEVKGRPRCVISETCGNVPTAPDHT